MQRAQFANLVGAVIPSNPTSGLTRGATGGTIMPILNNSKAANARVRV
jgi:hypothetical protein